MTVRTEIPVGGFGGGHFVFTDSGEFTRWRIHPGLRAQANDVAANRFHVWTRHGGTAGALTLSTRASSEYVFGPTISQPPQSQPLFPLTERSFRQDRLPVHLSFVGFSPLIPEAIRESSLPVHIVLWRAENRSDELVEVALMLTWACAWPHLQTGVVFDMQHDNLCITGTLGREDSPNRVGIAVPDLHSEGIYKQGMEPWDAAGNGAAIWEDFAEDGELELHVARGESIGAAAWVKFELDPGEAKEVPFVLAWHFPYYEAGPLLGQPRHYTRYLEKFRPDNAIVWLAEEVVQHYGAETANFRYWLQQIRDWHAIGFGNPKFTKEEHRERFNHLAAILQPDISFNIAGRFILQPVAGMSLESLQAFALEETIKDLWPEVAGSIETLYAAAPVDKFPSTPPD